MIDVIDLKKNFGDVEVLKGINTTINKGDIVAVLGPSGSGKSTFLRCLNCMEDPTGGSIIFKGVDIADIAAEGVEWKDWNINGEDAKIAVWRA